MNYGNTALRLPACDLRAIEQGEIKGTACTLHAAHHGEVNSAISQDCSLRNDQDCGRHQVVNASTIQLAA